MSGTIPRAGAKRFPRLKAHLFEQQHNGNLECLHISQPWVIKISAMCWKCFPEKWWTRGHFCFQAFAIPDPKIKPKEAISAPNVWAWRASRKQCWSQRFGRHKTHEELLSLWQVPKCQHSSFCSHSCIGSPGTTLWARSRTSLGLKFTRISVEVKTDSYGEITPKKHGEWKSPPRKSVTEVKGILQENTSQRKSDHQYLSLHSENWHIMR